MAPSKIYVSSQPKFTLTTSGTHTACSKFIFNRCGWKYLHLTMKALTNIAKHVLKLNLDWKAFSLQSNEINDFDVKFKDNADIMN